MKKNFIITLTLLILAFTASGKEFSYASIDFTVLSDSECSVKGQSLKSDDINIPEVAVDETGKRYSVTAISENAFYGNHDIKSIFIPASISNIGKDAFYGCVFLSHIEAASLLSWCSIQFANEYSNPLNGFHPLIIDGSPVVELVFPDNLDKIPAYTFYDCSSITSLTLPKATKAIGAHAFDGCENLCSANLMDSSLENIGDFAFNINISLSKLSFPSSLKTLGTGTFYKCEELVKVEGATQITSIPDICFAGCTALTDINFAKDLENIGKYSFIYCNSLKELIFSTKMKSIDSYAFDSCRGLESISFEGRDMALGLYIFSECTSLKKANLPKGLTYVPDGIFSLCTSLPEIELPETVSEIAQYAFAGCTSLKYIDFPEKLHTIGSRAFYGCLLFSSIEFGPNVELISPEAFYQCPSLNRILCRPINPPSLSFFGFDYNQNLNSHVIVPEISLELYRKAFSWRDFRNIEGSTAFNPNTMLTVDFGTGGTISNLVGYGKSKSITLRSEKGEIPVEVKINGQTVDPSSYPDGILEIPSITSPVTVTVCF